MCLLVVELAVSRFPDLTLSSSVCSSRSLRLHFIFINKLNVCVKHYLFHVEVGHSATHTHLLRNRVHQFHASFFTSHVVIYKLLNRRVMDPSGATRFTLSR